MFFCEFCKIFKNIFSFDTRPPDDCFLCLSVIFETFFRTLLLKGTPGKQLFYVKVSRISTTRWYSKKLFHRCFQAFYTWSRSSHSKAFIYLKSLDAVCEEVSMLWSCEIPTCNFTKIKLFHRSSFMYFAFIFLEYIKITSFEETLKVWEHKFFLEM